jgi:hypothetical protein
VYLRVGVNLRINDHYFPTYKLTDLTTVFHFDEKATTRPEHRSETYYTYQSTDHINFIKIYPLIRQSNYYSKMKTGRQGPDTPSIYTHTQCIDHWLDFPIVLRLLSTRRLKSASVCTTLVGLLLGWRWSEIIFRYELNFLINMIQIAWFKASTAK